MSIGCPKCGVEVAQPAGTRVEIPAVPCFKIQTRAWDKFNFYSGFNRSFTIPRSARDRNRCRSGETDNPLEPVYRKDCGTEL